MKFLRRRQVPDGITLAEAQQLQLMSRFGIAPDAQAVGEPQPSADAALADDAVEIAG